MKISLILIAVLFAVVPFLGLSAPSASAEQIDLPVLSPSVLYLNPYYTLNSDFNTIAPFNGDGLFAYYNPDNALSFPVAVTIYPLKALNSSSRTRNFVMALLDTSGSYSVLSYNIFDSGYEGLNLYNQIDISKPSTSWDQTLSIPSYTPGVPLVVSSEISIPSNFSMNLDIGPVDYDLINSISSDLLFSVTPFPEPLPETNFIGVWGETAEFVGDIFVQVGELFYDDTAEELTPIGTLAVILAGIAVVLLVWNLIRSFLPMRG